MFFCCVCMWGGGGMGWGEMDDSVRLHQYPETLRNLSCDNFMFT